ncbi:MAG: T9SS type A sorting domain-containing protein [Calditrichaeota bacterium]|nr:T9SS type A sorting domain-containing protein [Calditrichota bacterium]
MKTYFFTFLICIINALFLKIPTCYSQGIWTHYPDELPGNVLDMTQDKYGNYWFATDKGVCELDTEGIWHTLVDTTVWDSTMIFWREIEIDKNNNKWFVGVALSHATKEYVVKYDDSTFTYYNPSGRERDTWIFALGIDSSNNIWVGSDANYAYWFDGKVWHPFFVPGTYIYDAISDIKIDRQGNLYFAHDNGISSLEYGYMWGDGMRTVIELAFSKQNRLWFATLLDGLGMYDGTNWSLYTTKDGIETNLLNNVAIDSNQHVWISYAGYYGVSEFNGNHWQHFTQDSVLDGKFISDIFVDSKGEIWFAAFDEGVFVFQDTVTTLIRQQEKNALLTKTHNLFQNFPNPFNSETTIRYHLAQNGKVKLLIYNLEGKEVIKLFTGNQQVGEHQIVWNGKDKNGKDVSSGIYFYVLKMGSFTQIKKMTLIR